MLDRPGTVPVEPLPYGEIVWALRAADGLITDSGGLQKEVLLAGTPCMTLRAETEWPETLSSGWNVLERRPNRLADAIGRARPSVDRHEPFGPAGAAVRVIEAIERSVRA